jgi:hypothetical protein
MNVEEVANKILRKFKNTGDLIMERELNPFRFEHKEHNELFGKAIQYLKDRNFIEIEEKDYLGECYILTQKGYMHIHEI